MISSSKTGKTKENKMHFTKNLIKVLTQEVQKYGKICVLFYKIAAHITYWYVHMFVQEGTVSPEKCELESLW